MARFQREAQVLAALSHPHIAAIYGIEEDRGIRALVMELVEGPTLAERIAAGPVPLDEALAIARQISDALEAAHEKGIVHRDLKPANVKITPEGKVKVLDFGLAKAFESGSASADPANSPTLTMEATRAGMILGTAGYMSPEQARGKAVDKRADIWSFGVVFYEMLTGRSTFEGETVSDTLAAVLRADIDWNRLPAGTPFAVRRLLQRCLERDPHKRLRDIGDVWNDMDRPAETVAAHPARQWTSWALAALFVLAVAAAAWGWLRTPLAPPRLVTRSAMTLAGGGYSPALSRDGTRLAYDGSAPDGIWLRMMDQLEGKPIPGAEKGEFPAFSPDGQWIAYSTYPAPYKLKKIPVTGGASITLCDAPDAEGPDWGADDTIVFGSSKGLMRVPAAGGTPESLTAINAKSGETSHYDAELLPGGQAILFTISTTGNSLDSSHIAVLDLKTRAYRVLVNSGFGPRYVPTGHLVYSRGHTLFAVPFDLKRLVITGSETPVVEGVALGDYTYSDSSLLVFRASNGPGLNPSTLEWTDRKGVAEALPEPPHAWGQLAISPDGKLVAGTIQDSASTSDDGHSDIWIYDLERRTLARLTFEGYNTWPVWTPDGRWVTFASTREGKHGIYRVAADKSGQPELLLAAEAGVESVVPSSWTPDGKMLFYNQIADGKSHIWILPAPGGGESKPRQFSETSFSEHLPKVSPDGKWVAYFSSESGKSEVYVVPFPGPGGKSQISTQGGRLPTWSHSGRELFYREPVTSQLMAVDVQTAPVFRAGRPQALFKLNGGYDAMPDGKRFLVQRLPERASTTTFVTVTNWFDDLLRRAPVKH
jgi:serine/threonine-protein kinase